MTFTSGADLYYTKLQKLRPSYSEFQFLGGGRTWSEFRYSPLPKP